jgi:uncharacterized protein YndB with AHSA1/START domain
MKLSASITIPRPARDVFAFISDVTNMPLWVTGVTAAKMVSDAMGPGARFACDYRPNWRADRIEMEVVSYDPPQSMCTRSSRRSPFPFEGCVSLRETDQGTIVTNTIEAGPDSLSTRLATVLLGPLLRRSMQKRLARELNDLEHAVTA